MNLFQPGWKSQDYNKAMKSLEKIKDDQTLFDISTQAPNRQVRLAAVSRIRDDKLLYNLEWIIFDFAAQGLIDHTLFLSYDVVAKQQGGGIVCE